MWCVHGARDNLVFPTMKWSGPMIYKHAAVDGRSENSSKRGVRRRYVMAGYLPL